MSARGAFAVKIRVEVVVQVLNQVVGFRQLGHFFPNELRFFHFIFISSGLDRDLYGRRSRIVGYLLKRELNVHYPYIVVSLYNELESLSVGVFWRYP